MSFSSTRMAVAAAAFCSSSLFLSREVKGSSCLRALKVRRAGLVSMHRLYQPAILTAAALHRASACSTCLHLNMCIVACVVPTCKCDCCSSALSFCLQHKSSSQHVHCSLCCTNLQILTVAAVHCASACSMPEQPFCNATYTLQTMMYVTYAW